MTLRSMNTRRGYTLVEMVIVILILGSLAVVAAPKLLNTSATATDNGLRRTLSVVRDAIDLYAPDNGALPGADESPLTFKTDMASYLRGKFPRCPVGPAQNRKVKMVNVGGPISGEPSPARAWKFNYETGEFIVNYNQPTSYDASVNYDDL